MHAADVAPLGDRVLVRRVPADTMSEGGIFIPDNAKEKPIFADVVGVGPDVRDVRPGDRVIFAKYTGSEVTVEDAEDHLLMHEDDVIAVVEPPEASSDR